MTLDTRTCKDCPFFDPFPKKDPYANESASVTEWADDGHCRVNPPEKMGFPEVRHDRDWCSIIRPGLRVDHLIPE